MDAARRLAGSLDAFSGALGSDATGLGKTFVALAVATRYRRVVAVVPAILESQWRRRAAQHDIVLSIVSHERLSRTATVPRADLLIVDEAHRFRNPRTRRYAALTHRPGPDHVLLLTATPVVNRAADLAALLALFLPDNGLAPLGVPSIECAVTERRHDAIARAASVLTVSRSADVVHGALPFARDSSVHTSPPVDAGRLAPLLEQIAALQFPTFADRTAARLMDLHLRYRLASSPQAARETVRHHLAYLDRAIDAAARGERLTRPAAGILSEECDGQLELELVVPGRAAAVDSGELLAERLRVRALLDEIDRCNGPGPKTDSLRALLAARAGRKTIVFTAAIATARAIAVALGWHRVAVVSGRGAWIASGRIPVATALSLFAPVARAAQPAAPAQEVTTLIATDLASEGLDLQDADAVVHYDLPWTPLRLSQRLGRIARLGSSHASVEVHWFAPPPELDAGLALRQRIRRKLETQLALGVAESSGIGSARILGHVLQWKERLAALPSMEGTGGLAVVPGPPTAAFALCWKWSSTRVFEILVSDSSSAAWFEELRRVVRERLRFSSLPASDARTADVSRLLIRRARAAARSRDGTLLAVIDRALGLLAGGVRPGRIDLLRQALAGRRNRDGIAGWLTSQPVTRGEVTVSLASAVIGDGSRNTLSSPPRG